MMTASMNEFAKKFSEMPNSVCSNPYAEEWDALKAYNLSAEELYNLGERYFNGDEGSQDNLKASLLFDLAAKQGHPQAQCKLGIMYLKGQGVSKSNKKAFRFFREAAKNGSPKALYNLGVMYYFENPVVDIVDDNDQEAYRLFTLAANKGHTEAKYFLKKMD
jgi:TPR repeat protein